MRQVPERLRLVAAQLGVDLESDWSGIDAVWPLIAKMRSEGAVVVIKVDGERDPRRDGGAYTVLVSGRHIKDMPIRADRHSVEDALLSVLSDYSAQVW